MADEPTCLIVRHLPAELTTAEQEDLLRHFGATHVRTMGSTGRLKHVTFASFADHDLAEVALKRLHQMEILGTKLVVEFSRNEHCKFLPSMMDSYKKVKGPVAKDAEVKKPKVLSGDIDMKKIAEKVNCISKQWQVEYALNPHLEYMYPSPTVNILTNIANALASVPRFYVQVLHLMNKMNLPAPFGPVTPTPVLREGKPVQQQKDTENSSVTEPVSTEESEIESEEEGEHKESLKPSMPLKRLKKQPVRPRKKPKLIQTFAAPVKPRTVGPKPSEVFDQPNMTGPKKIEFKLTTEVQNEFMSSNQSSQHPAAHVDQPLPGAPPLPPPDVAADHIPAAPGMWHVRIDEHIPTEVPSSTDIPSSDLPNVPVNAHKVVQGGFGKIEPAPKPLDQDDDTYDTVEEWGESEFIRSRELSKGRLSSSEIRDLAVFRKYNPGEPSARLYIKNLAKPVTDKDLHFIYGRYVDWTEEEHCNMFDIRLMKEGRMKGQAFVTLPDTKRAQQAVRSTNGYVLHGKPMVVQFARSAKPKDDTKDKDKQK